MQNLWARLALSSGLLAATMGAVPAQAEEGVAIKSLLGSMGVIPAEKDPIRYRERAPLVLPPKMELRAPSGAENYASANPQWPNDPDVAARRRRSAEQATPVTESEIRRMSENNPRLSIDEIRAGRNPNNAGPGRHVSDRDGVWVHPRDLAAGAKPDSDAGAGVEWGQRRTLADPPAAFRQASKGGPVKNSFEPRVDQQERDANPINWLVNKFKRDDDD